MHNTVVIGYGYWGRNVARNVHENPDLNLVAVFDLELENRLNARRTYPYAHALHELTKFNFAEDDMVFVCTPPQTHADVLAHLRKVGVKSVCMPKPYCTNIVDAQEYADMVKLVDYTFLFSNAVKKLPEYLLRIGHIYHISCTRANLGKVQECGVALDLTVHDISILKYLGFELEHLWSGHYNGLVQEMMFKGHLSSDPVSTTIHVHNSWLSHLKRKTMVFTGETGTVVYDDNEPTDKITIYDKFIERPDDTDLMQYKYGDTLIPYIPSNNPLGEMVEAYRLAHINDSTHETVKIALDVHRLL